MIYQGKYKLLIVVANGEKLSISEFKEKATLAYCQYLKDKADGKIKLAHTTPEKDYTQWREDGEETKLIYMPGFVTANLLPDIARENLIHCSQVILNDMEDEPNYYYTPSICIGPAPEKILKEIIGEVVYNNGGYVFDAKGKEYENSGNRK